MAKDPPKTKPREYVVCKRVGSIEMEIRGTAKATSASRAIDALRPKDEGGRWVAVPLRNWGEEDLSIEQREPVVRRKRMHPGQTEIEVPSADEPRPEEVAA